MSLYTVPASDQFTADGKEYFKFPLSNVGWRVFWTTAPKDLKRCPRVELNRLVRMFEEKGLVLPMTLRRIKKADVLALITPLLAFS
jgi:hypothetical protein